MTMPEHLPQLIETPPGRYQIHSGRTFAYSASPLKISLAVVLLLKNGRCRPWGQDW